MGHVSYTQEKLSTKHLHLGIHFGTDNVSKWRIDPLGLQCHNNGLILQFKSEPLKVGMGT